MISMLRIVMFIVALSPIFVAGCATQKPPIETSLDVEAAKVRFINRISGGWIDLYPETECNHGINVIYDRAIANVVKSISEGAPKRIEMLDPPISTDRNVSEYSFKAGQVINVGIGGNARRGCLGGLSFVAAPASQYEVTLSDRSPSKCMLTVSILYAENGITHRRAVRDLRPLVCQRAHK
jgi:hypothetical protein